MECECRFMKDSSETEANKEAVMDFVISWMVRYAAYGNAIEKPQLYQYCRRCSSSAGGY